jgi:hypothetical protein
MLSSTPGERVPEPDPARPPPAATTLSSLLHSASTASRSPSVPDAACDTQVDERQGTFRDRPDASHITLALIGLGRAPAGVGEAAAMAEALL